MGLSCEAEGRRMRENGEIGRAKVVEFNWAHAPARRDSGRGETVVQGTLPVLVVVSVRLLIARLHVCFLFAAALVASLFWYLNKKTGRWCGCGTDTIRDSVSSECTHNLKRAFIVTMEINIPQTVASRTDHEYPCTSSSSTSNTTTPMTSLSDSSTAALLGDPGRHEHQPHIETRWDLSPCSKNTINNCLP